MNNWLNIIGLLFDIIGVVGLFLFGVPNKKINEGVFHFEDYDTKMEERHRKYSLMSLILILVGFVFQFISAMWKL